MYRQGDVLLVSTKKKLKLENKGTATLALGEVTGHSHQMVGVEFNSSADGLATELLIHKPTELVHQEHEPIVIPAGSYTVLVQREYDVVEGVRQVLD